MTLATLGWAVIWIALCLTRWAPGWAPSPDWCYAVADVFAVIGLALGVFTLRAKLAWILITAAPLFANASLLSLKYVVPNLLHAEAQQPTDELGHGNLVQD